MAVKLIANYSKRLGLPGYSSHQFSVSVETELVKTDDVACESRRLYELLQSNVDEQITRTGFVPPSTYGMEDDPAASPGPRAGRRGLPVEAANRLPRLALLPGDSREDVISPDSLLPPLHSTRRPPDSNFL